MFLNGEHDATYTQRVRRCIFRLGPGRRRRVELHQLQPAVAVRSPHHCDVDSDVVEPNDAVHPTSLDRHLALQLQTKFDKERDSTLEVVDNDADVIHPLDRHALDNSGTTVPATASLGGPVPAARLPGNPSPRPGGACTCVVAGARKELDNDRFTTTKELRPG